MPFLLDLPHLLTAARLCMRRAASPGPDDLSWADYRLDMRDRHTHRSAPRTGVDLSTVDTRDPATSLSGGQRQRIGLARAIVRRHDVLLLDEATAQVDALTEAAMLDAIRHRAADGAVVTIAHRLSTVLDADLIIVLEAGRVRAQGTHAELLVHDELYRRLVEALRIAAVTESALSEPTQA